MGAGLGGLVESWLQVDIVPVLGIGSPAVVVSEFVLFSLWASSLYLRWYKLQVTTVFACSKKNVHFCCAYFFCNWQTKVERNLGTLGRKLAIVCWQFVYEGKKVLWGWGLAWSSCRNFIWFWFETWLILLVILSIHMPRLSVFEGYHCNLNCMHSVSVEKAFPIVLRHNFFYQAESRLVANLWHAIRWT